MTIPLYGPDVARILATSTYINWRRVSRLVRMGPMQLIVRPHDDKPRFNGVENRRNFNFAMLMRMTVTARAALR